MKQHRSLEIGSPGVQEVKFQLELPQKIHLTVQISWSHAGKLESVKLWYLLGRWSLPFSRRVLGLPRLRHRRREYFRIMLCGGRFVFLPLKNKRTNPIKKHRDKSNKEAKQYLGGLVAFGSAAASSSAITSVAAS